MGRFLIDLVLVTVVAFLLRAGYTAYRSWTDNGPLVQRLCTAPHDPYGVNVTTTVADLFPVGMNPSELWRVTGDNRFTCVGSILAGPYLVICDRAGSNARMFCPRHWRLEFLFDRQEGGPNRLNRTEATAREDC